MYRAVVTSDLHLRADRPLCRLDPDWMEAQRNKLKELVGHANRLDADLLICGDIFDTPNVPASVVNLFIQEMNKMNQRVHIIAGNHSLPYHKQENLMSSSIGIIAILEDYPIIYHPCKDNTMDGIFEHAYQFNATMAMVHTLTFEKEIPFGARAYTAKQILDRYDEVKFIFTGDNHTAFHYENNGRHVINPGTPIIQSASMLDYQPICYYINGDEVQIILLSSDRDMLTDNHLQEKHERDDRISAFVDVVKRNGQVSLSFLDNLTRTIEKNNIAKEIIAMLEEIQREAVNG
jgi:predicted phosphodiesterase